MEIIISPNSFKGTFSSVDACNIIAEGLLNYDSKMNIKKLPIADGGDGTLTPTTFANGSTITFNDVGDSVMLIYNTTGGWALVSNTGCTIA